MQTEKNVLENLFYTIMNDRVKSKYKNKSRSNCKYLGVPHDLWMDEKGDMPYEPDTIT